MITKENAIKAAKWNEYISAKCPEQIKYSVDNTVIYSDLGRLRDTWEFRGFDTIIQVTDEDSVSAIINHKNGKTAVLNFASYKEPGGLFLQGSSAQEESLCHESFLFNVLSKFGDFYDYNKKHLNHGLYLNRGLYSPMILFREKVHCDVITCPAPNASYIRRYGSLPMSANQYALAERIFFVLAIAAVQKVDTLILGAYGCGVFKQDPHEAAELFNYYLKEKFAGVFEKVIFAIPDRSSKNHLAFREILKSD